MTSTFSSYVENARTRAVSITIMFLIYDFLLSFIVDFTLFSFFVTLVFWFVGDFIAWKVKK